MSSDAVKRIMAEVRELQALNTQPGSFFTAAPLETDLFEWHFTVRGPPETPFAAGLYHGRILLPPEYPLKAPEIILLTPNGRFEVGTRICLSVTSHHNETWQPSWGVRTILTALVGFMPSKSEGLGALDYPAEDRRVLARKSLSFACPRCGVRPAEQFPDHMTGSSAAQVPDASTNVVSEESAPVVSSAATGESSAQGRPESAEPTSRGSSSVAPTAASHSSGVAATGRPQDPVRSRTRPPAARQRRGSPNQEKELLYLACVIGVAIFAILARRVMNTFF